MGTSSNRLIVQDQLNKLYKETLTKDDLHMLNNKNKLSAPLLINIQDSYLNANLKIMYIGKEVNHWLTHRSRAKEKRGLNYFINDNESAFDELLLRYDKRMLNKTDWSSSNFFKQYKNIKDQLVDTDTGNGSVVWNNLFKMAYDSGNGYSKTSLGHSNQLQRLSKALFLNELDILKPNVLIFVTGSSYDKVIKDYLKEYETIEVIIPKKIWKFKFQNKLCYRTVHPDSMRFTKKNKRVDYYQMIIDDIQKELSSQ